MIMFDAVRLWARGHLQRLARLTRLMTGPERRLLLVLLVLLSVSAATTEWGAFAVAFGATLLLAPVLADAVILRQWANTQVLLLADAREVAIAANAAKPSGAPRVAEVPCSHGVMQRFVYGPDGWSPAGPAPDTRHEEAHTS